MKDIYEQMMEEHEEIEKEMPIQFGEWQLCPKCNGQGTVCKPPLSPGDVDNWTASSTVFTCDVCNGAKILARPILKVDIEWQKK